MTSDLNQRQDAFVNVRWGQLYALEKDWGERALRYLLLTNFGGAVATISFLGASEQARVLLGVKVSLGLFLVGIILVGVSTAKTLHRMSWLFKEWKSAVNHYNAGRVSWDHLIEEDNKRAVESFWDYAIPYTSFGCFILGCVLGPFALFFVE